jgi:predicted metal-dependent hydrolase
MTATMERTAKLRVRRPKIDFSATPKYWVLGDPQATHSVNILNFGIPAGERFFIDSVRLAMPYIRDKALAADARSFIGQETLHARYHEKASEHLGLFDRPDVRAQIEAMDRLRVRLYKRIDRLPEPFRRRATITWLSTTLLGEHFTALFADLVFDRRKIDRDAIDPAMGALLGWHAAEEMEHRTLPYDIYEHIGGDYVTRVLPLALTMGLLPVGLVGITDRLMRADPDLRGGFSVRDHVRAVRARRTPSFLDVFAKLPMYFKRGYHPSQVGDDFRAREYLASNPPSLMAAS